MHNMNVCRICHENCCNGTKCVNSCCMCKGSLEHVHARCILKWIRMTNQQYCNICSCQFTHNVLILEVCDSEDEEDHSRYTAAHISPPTFALAVLTSIFIKAVYNSYG